MSFQKACLICIASLLTGCASLSYPLPKCDGSAKRPLNRSMWQWQEERAGIVGQRAPPSAGAAATPLNYADPAPIGTGQHPAFASFDEAGSHSACRVG